MADPQIASPAGIRIVNTPDGNNIAAPGNKIYFTSADLSVAITGNETTREIDFSASGSSILNRFIIEEIPGGVQNGINLVFTTANFFINANPGLKPQVYLNGQRLIQGEDFTCSESGGPTTGFDTITLIYVAPRSDDNFYVDYVKDI